MFFLGNPLQYYYNELGVAFSNDLSSNNWIKYPKQLINKTWEEEGDYMLSSGSKAWGVGQPSAVSLDKKGKILLTYTIGDVDGTRAEFVILDCSDMDNIVIPQSKKVVNQGLKKLNNARDYASNVDIAINQEDNIIIMTRPVHDHPQSYPSFIVAAIEVNYMDLNAFLAGIGGWNTIFRLTPEITGYPRNHNAGIERDSFGHLEDWKNPVVYYTVSKEEPDVSSASQVTRAEWTYHIWRAEIKQIEQ